MMNNNIQSLCIFNGKIPFFDHMKCKSVAMTILSIYFSLMCSEGQDMILSKAGCKLVLI